MKNIIFEYFYNIPSSQLNISMIDVFNEKLCKKQISFSGTVNFYKPKEVCDSLINNKDERYTKKTRNQINTIISDDVVQGSIIASILGVTNVIPHVKYYIDENKEETLIKDIIDNINMSHDASNKIVKYNCLIDTAGIILNIKPFELILRLRDEINSHDGNNIKFYYIENNIKLQYINGIVKPYMNEIIDSNSFIYYDNMNCIGIDFKQSYSLHGLVTISNKNTLTDIAQGIFRLRNINVGHTIDFYIPDKLFEDRTDINNKIYQYIDKVEEIKKEKLLGTLKLQCLKYDSLYFVLDK